MSVKDIEKSVNAAIFEEEKSGRLAEEFETRLGLDARIIRALIAFIMQYVRAAPELLDKTAANARKQGVLKEFQPILEMALAYWTQELGLASKSRDLVTLADDAYLSNALIHFTGTVYEGMTGTPLLSTQFHRSNLAMRQLFGSESAIALDSRVNQTMHRAPMRQAIRNLANWRGTLDVDITMPALNESKLNASLERVEPSVLQTAAPVLFIPTPVREPTKGGHSYRVWYATNRQPVKVEDSSEGFTNQPDPENKMHYGRCQVFVPRSHKPGSLGAWYKRWLPMILKDDHLKLMSHKPVPEVERFFETLRSEIHALGKGSRHLLVYIHGYNVSFEDAVLRAAQIGFDLEIPGETVLFSWPSGAKKDHYVADGGRVEDSEGVLQEFLIRTASDVGAEAVHLVAHSMGNRGLLRAAEGLAAAGVKFANIILAAPDVQRGLFRQRAPTYLKIARHTTLYVSPKDLALKVSSARLLNDGPRAGLTPPITILPNIDTVQVKQFNLFDLGHGYWAEAREVITDIYQLMRFDAAPPRAFLHKETSKDGDYWSLQ